MKPSPLQNQDSYFSPPTPGVSKALIILFVVVLLITASIAVYYYFSLKSKAGTTSFSDMLPYLMTGIRPTPSPQETIRKVAEKPWNPQTFPITARAIAVDKETKILLLEFSWPPQVVGRVQHTKIRCGEEDYSMGEVKLESPRSPPTKIPSEEFFNLLETGSYAFSGFCSDESCGVIDRGCRALSR